MSTSAAARPPRTTGAAPPVGAGGTRGSRFFGFCARSAIVQRRAKHLWSRDSAPGLKSRRQTPCKGYLRAERTEKRGLSRIQFYRVELKWKPIVKYTAFCCLRIVCRSSSSCEFQFALKSTNCRRWAIRNSRHDEISKLFRNRQTERYERTQLEECFVMCGDRPLEMKRELPSLVRQRSRRQATNGGDIPFVIKKPKKANGERMQGM